MAFGSSSWAGTEPIHGRPEKRQKEARETRWAKAFWITVAAAVACLVANDVIFAQCAMCKTGLLNSPEGQRMASGFNRGILFLLTVPFLVLGAVALLILNARRRHEGKYWSALSARRRRANG